MSWLKVNFEASERRVCGLMSIAVNSFRYKSMRSDEPLSEQRVSGPGEASVRRFYWSEQARVRTTSGCIGSTGKRDSV